MRQPTQAEINDTIVLLMRQGRLLAFCCDTGAGVNLATAAWVARHGLPGPALNVDQVRRQLAAHEAEMMGEWN